MVLEIPNSDWRKLSHKERRKLINKEKKKFVRRQLAQERTDTEKAIEKLEQLPEYKEHLAAEERELQKMAAQRQLEHDAWLEHDGKSHKEFVEKKEKEEQKLRDREEREKLIREEWEALERKEKDKEQSKPSGSRGTGNEGGKSKKEALLAEALSDIDKTIRQQENLHDVHMPWHNPYAPIDFTQVAKAMNLLDDEPGGGGGGGGGGNKDKGQDETSAVPEKESYGTEKDRINCPFFIKTGACRYGDHCSRVHPVPLSSTTLIIRGMYSHVVLTQNVLGEHDEDVGLEMDEDDMQRDFKEFFADVFPEFEKFGEIVQFKVSCNYESHLRGNLYVQYANEESCGEAIKAFNGRYYAGKQLSCEFCPVEKWKTAICGEFVKQGHNNRHQCPKGRHCNFLHVFTNPGGKFDWPEEDNKRRGRRSRSRSPRDRTSRYGGGGGRGGGEGRGGGGGGGGRGRHYSSSQDDRRPYNNRRSSSPGTSKRYNRRSDDYHRRRSRSPHNKRHKQRGDSRSPDHYRRKRRDDSRSRRRRSSSGSSRDDYNGRRYYSSDDSDSDLSPVRKGSNEKETKKRGGHKHKHKKHHHRDGERRHKKHHKKKRYSSDDDESDD